MLLRVRKKVIGILSMTAMLSRKVGSAFFGEDPPSHAAQPNAPGSIGLSVSLLWPNSSVRLLQSAVVGHPSSRPVRGLPCQVDMRSPMGTPLVQRPPPVALAFQLVIPLLHSPVQCVPSPPIPSLLPSLALVPFLVLRPRLPITFPFLSPPPPPPLDPHSHTSHRLSVQFPFCALPSHS